jgi:hypothetical protein
MPADAGLELSLTPAVPRPIKERIALHPTFQSLLSFLSPKYSSTLKQHFQVVMKEDWH